MRVTPYGRTRGNDFAAGAIQDALSLSQCVHVTRRKIRRELLRGFGDIILVLVVYTLIKNLIL